jgi:hypothetical protein
MGSGKFISRMPVGIVTTTSKGIRQVADMFSVQQDPEVGLKIVGGVTKKTIHYPCGNPCVVDGPTFLGLWLR